MFTSALAMLRPEHPVLRVLVLTTVFLALARGYAAIGRATLRRLMASRHGRRFVPALYGAGLGVWVVVVWVVFS